MQKGFNLKEKLKGCKHPYIVKFSQSYNNWVIKLMTALVCKKMLSEWGLWNNSWVKNLPIRPLAPRRATQGQLYSTFRPPGQGQNFLIILIKIKIILN